MCSIAMLQNSVVSKYGDYKNSDGTSSDSKSGDYLTIIY